jgi:hypothetical protein
MDEKRTNLEHRREPIHPDDVEAGVGQPRDANDVLADRKPGSGTNVRRDDAQPRSSTKPMAEKKPGSGA